MSLKFKRNVPVLLLLVALLSCLAFALGHWPIIAYAVK
jgi:hypothetical protein